VEDLVLQAIKTTKAKFRGLIGPLRLIK